MKSFVLTFCVLLLAFCSLNASAAPGGINRAGRQHRAYVLGLRAVFQHTKDNHLHAMGRTRWEIRQQRRDARRFGL